MKTIERRKLIHEQKELGKAKNEAAAKKLKEEGLSNAEIAEQMNVSESIVRLIVK